MAVLSPGPLCCGQACPLANPTQKLESGGPVILRGVRLLGSGWDGWEKEPGWGEWHGENSWHRPTPHHGHFC